MYLYFIRLRRLFLRIYMVYIDNNKCSCLRMRMQIRIFAIRANLHNVKDIWINVEGAIICGI